MVWILTASVFLTVCGCLSTAFPTAGLEALRETALVKDASLTIDKEENELKKANFLTENIVLDTIDRIIDLKGDYHLVLLKKYDPNNPQNANSHRQEIVFNKVSRMKDLKGDSYLILLKTTHRSKRYASYLTMCPFKICNMGRKWTRNRRYVDDIRSVRDNEAE